MVQPPFPPSDRLGDFSKVVRALTARGQNDHTRGVVYLAPNPDGAGFQPVFSSLLKVFVETTPNRVYFGMVVGGARKTGPTRAVLGKFPQIRVNCVKRRNLRQEIMGRTYQLVVLDMRAQFVPNDFVICAEACAGGGLIVIVGPPLEELEHTHTKFQAHLEAGRARAEHRYLARRFQEKLHALPGLVYWNERAGTLHTNPASQKGRPVETLAEEVTTRYEPLGKDAPLVTRIIQDKATAEQWHAIARLSHFFRESKKKNGKAQFVSVTGGRGRGKSTCLGLWASQFFTPEADQALGTKATPATKSALLTSASLEQVQVLLRTIQDTLAQLGVHVNVLKAKSLLQGFRNKFFALSWVPPAEALEKRRVGFLLVDEASAVPMQTLEQLPSRISFVIATTTTTGYEGTGRGFLLQLLPSLRAQDHTRLRELSLSRPIRYDLGDPVEEFLHQTFLLDVNLPELSQSPRNEGIRTAYLPRAALFQDERMLRAFWALMLLGHYRNSPNDLALVGDQPGVHLFGATLASNLGAGTKVLVGGAHVVEEGGLAGIPARRIPGHLIATQLARHYQDPGFAQLAGYRVVRIAVDPRRHRRGTGTALLNAIEERARDTGIDWCGASLALSRPHLAFWHAAGYQPLFVSPSTHPSNLNPSITVVKPLSERAGKRVTRLARRFREIFTIWLREIFYDLPVEDAIAVLRACSLPPGDHSGYWAALRRTFTLHPTHLARLAAFVTHDLEALAVVDVLDPLCRLYWLDPRPCDKPFSLLEEKVLVLRVMGRTWAQIARRLHLPAAQVYGIFRKVVDILLKKYSDAIVMQGKKK